MKLFYFGDSQNPLFGAFHPPRGPRSAEFAILICPPIAHEYVRTHRALRQLATALAAGGFPVMRFDYFGVGDSAGESGEGGPLRWTKDILMALEELLALSNKISVCLIGLRLGAALATAVLSGKTACNRLVLWDPVISGTRMFEDFTRLQVESYPGKNVEKNTEELVGFPYPSALRQEICGLDLLQSRPAGLKSVVILAAETQPDISILRQHLSAFTPACVQLPFSDVTDWLVPKAIDKTLIANHAIETIVSVLTGKKQ